MIGLDIGDSILAIVIPASSAAFFSRGDRGVRDLGDLRDDVESDGSEVFDEADKAPSIS